MDKCTNQRMENITLPNDNYKVVLVFAYIILLFTVTQVLGLYTGNFIIQDITHNEIVRDLQLVSEPNEIDGVFYIFFYIMLGTLIMYLLIKFYHGELIFILLEFTVISFSSSIVFYSFLRVIFLEFSAIVIAVAFGLGLGFLKTAFPWLKNIVAVIATAGAGAVFGFSFSFYHALIFLILLSIYDYIAVFKTKHMIEIARVLSKKGTSFLISSKQKTMHGEISFELGTGDMLIPIILEVSGYRINPIYSAIAFSASLFSLFVLFILLTKKKTVLPALPIIAICNFLFFGVAKLIEII